MSDQLGHAGGAQTKDREMHSHDTKAVCRGCGLELRGKA